MSMDKQMSMELMNQMNNAGDKQEKQNGMRKQSEANVVTMDVKHVNEDEYEDVLAIRHAEIIVFTFHKVIL